MSAPIFVASCAPINADSELCRDLCGSLQALLACAARMEANAVRAASRADLRRSCVAHVRRALAKRVKLDIFFFHIFHIFFFSWSAKSGSAVRPAAQVV